MHGTPRLFGNVVYINSNWVVVGYVCLYYEAIWQH